MPTSQISVRLPVNLTENEAALFVPYDRFSLPRIKIKDLEDVFVSDTGLCFTSKELIPESVHSYPEYMATYNEEVRQADHFTHLKKTEKYLVIHHPWFNYYHWITESIPRLWLVKDIINDLTLLLPESYYEEEFVQSSLKPFHFKKIQLTPEKKYYFVPKLCLPQIKPVCAMYDKRIVNEIRQFYGAYFSTGKTSHTPGKRIYVSREKSSRRKFLNEAAVLDVLRNYSFDIIYPEELNFEDQVALMHSASCLIGQHGAGLTNMHFMSPNGKVLELHKKATNVRDHHSLVYWYLANSLDHQYFHQICEPADENQDFYSADLIADVELLAKNIDSMIEL